MQMPLEIAFTDIAPSDALKFLIEQEAKTLDEFHSHITSCRVAVSLPEKRHRSGAPFDIRVLVRMPPGKEIAVARPAADHPEREHAEVAVREVFDAARRQIQDQIRRMRGDVKAHAAEGYGRVARLVRDDGFGFIETADGRELYFHRNAVSGHGYDRLEEGTEVTFTEDMGDKGPRAVTVHALGSRVV
jgi:cold shock CspA family protein